tara:strand:- start:96 stop:692 length:597 start_codon:yes stop_codon:yes gene_type:complete
MKYFNVEEKPLIKLSKSGDAKAFEEIIRRNKDYLLGWILKKTHDELAAEELLQMTLIKCWKNIDKFRGDSKFSTWACTISRNLFIDNYRKSKKKNEISLNSIEESDESRIGGVVEGDPLTRFKDKELGVFLDRIMDKLSFEHRSVLHYFAVEELTYYEISLMMQCSVGTVMSRLYYARKKAQEILSKDKDNKIYCYDK